MAGFFYTRQYGPDGQILCGEGDAEGTSLRELVRRERPPLRATLELGAALGDLLCIAQEDGAVHGGLTPDFVVVDEYGDVSIAGMGVARDGGAAPERRGDVPTVDLFGVGAVIYETIAGAALPKLPADADEHDDTVVGAILDLDFSQVQGKKWLDEVRRFVARLLAWSPDDRPAALDAANVLGSVAAQVPGDGLDAWARRVHTKKAAPAPAPAPAAFPESVPLRAMPEILDQPLSLTAPFKPGGVRKAPAAKGESTSFWSRERIAELLAEEDDDEPPPPRNGRLTAEVEVSRSTLDGGRRPPADKPRSSERLDAPAAVQFDAPRAEPTRSGAGRSDPSRAPADPTASRYPGGEVEGWTPEPARPRSERPVETFRPPEPTRPRAAEPERVPARPAEPVRTQSRPPEPARPASPKVAMPISEGRGPSAPLDEEEAGGGGKMIFAAGGLMFFLIALCGGGVVLAGGWWWWSTRTPDVPAVDAPKTEEPKAEEPKAEEPKTEAVVPATEPAKAEAPKEEPKKAEPPKTEPKKTEAPKTDPKKTETPKTDPKATTTTTTKPATTTTTTTTTTTKPTTTTTKPTTTTTSGPFTVRFSVAGQEGKVSCGDGQVAKFSGAINLSFQSSQSCRIDAGGLRTVVTVSRATTVTCATSGSGLSCSGGN